MLKWIIKKRLDVFERGFDYDATYLRELLATDVGAVMAFAKATGALKYRKDIPVDAHYAAKLIGTMHEDCGPCTQLNVTMAEREGVPQATIAAIIAGDDAAMPEHVRLVAQFSRAALAHDLAADPLREAIVERWGPRALASIAMALCAARMFPTMKYALGHGHACSRIHVGQRVVAPA